MLYNYTFISLERWTEPTPSKYHRRLLCPITPFIEPLVSLDNYNNQLIIWITTFNAESSITRSCYLRLTLYGYRETPFSNHFLKNHNAKSIKPNHHGNGNFNNYKCMDASKKVNGEAIWLVALPHYKQNIS